MAAAEAVLTHASDISVAKRDDELEPGICRVHPRRAQVRCGVRFVMVRLAWPRIAAALVLCSLGLAAPVRAQEVGQPRVAEGTIVPSESAQTPRATAIAPTIQPRRPASLIPLYVSFGALQALDMHSTSRAIDSGGAEANPVMKPFVGSTAGLLAIKAAGTAGVVYIGEKMWRRNRKAAVIFMIAANSAMTWVVQHNYRTSGR